MPVTVTVEMGEPGSLLAMLRVPSNVVALEGMKVTVTLRLEFGGSSN